ncbi:MAG: BsaWI family type II restriction enzyme [Aridibacter sp.]
MTKTIRLINHYVSQSELAKDGWKNVFNKMHDILYEAKPFVDEYLADRKSKGIIKDEKQAMKSIAGNSFSFGLIYIFLHNKIYGNINPHIFMTSQKSKVKNFNTLTTINVDGETQKPDCDLIIYSYKENEEMPNCIILSLKTSLRERAGQTYRWKLLMEIASTENSIKDKYNISYDAVEMPLVCFATVNFYNEINNPQSRGMFKFFDKAFIAKNVDADFVAKLSELPDYVNENL